jgi:peroxiredoxin Q/BCP
MNTLRLSTHRKRNGLTWVGLCALLVAPSVLAQVKVGDTAPDFSLTGSDGKMHRLADYRGKQAVVIAWFPKAFTGGCTTECKSLRDAGEALKKLPVAVFAASVDDAATNAKFAASLGLNFPILSDPTKATAKAYGVLNANGMASRTTVYIGADGNILHLDQAVQPSSHGQTVADQLAKLGVGR